MVVGPGAAVVAVVAWNLGRQKQSLNPPQTPSQKVLGALGHMKRTSVHSMAHLLPAFIGSRGRRRRDRPNSFTATSSREFGPSASRAFEGPSCERANVSVLKTRGHVKGAEVLIHRQAIQ